MIQISLSANNKTDADPLRVSDFTTIVNILPSPDQESNEEEETIVPEEPEEEEEVKTESNPVSTTEVISEAEKLETFIADRDEFFTSRNSTQSGNESVFVYD